MFCPECGTLSFPDRTNQIRCCNYTCGYSGDAENIITLDDGWRQVNLARIVHHQPAPEPGFDQDGRVRGTIAFDRREIHNSVNEAMYQEWRDMREGWSHGVTRYDVQNYGSGSG